jgi:hypothetical protein
MKGTGREGEAGGERGGWRRWCVMHGHFCKVRSLKMKEEREDWFQESEERSSRSQKKIMVEWLLVEHVTA